MRIQVIGGGSWGLALARLAALNRRDVRLWCRDEDRPDILRDTRSSPFFLKAMTLPESVDVNVDVDDTPDIAVIAVPSHALRSVIARFHFGPATIRVSVAKGIENETLLRMSQVIETMHGPIPVVALSGPSHAEEVSQDRPVSLVAASTDTEARDVVQQAFMSNTSRIYTSPDVVGVELGGALKNVIAIAAGVCDGFNLGDNAKAALVTRGLHEISRLGAAMGADALTFSGLSGMGDLIVTCMSRLSRNREVGERLGKGNSLETILGGMTMVAEGVRTTQSAYALAHRHHVEMPITEQVHRILFEDQNPREAVAALMQRDPKPERH